MSCLSEKRYPRVAGFYNEKSILITGAAGFLGMVLLETLLRCCPGIQYIYIVLREKKGVKPENRKGEILEKRCFDKLRAENPDVFEKVQVVAGDVSNPDLGMSKEDLQKVIRDVNIVFHCAASISFLRPLRYILEHNAVSTQHAIDLCRKLKKLDAFINTSTAYSNCNRKSLIQEEVYRLPFPAQKFLDHIKNGSDEKLQQIVSECQPSWPNFYTFSKCVAENVIQDNASDIPVGIIRPSLIVPSWRGSLPGFMDGNAGIVALSLGVGKGFIRVLHADPKVEMDLVPVDVVANTHVLAAWSLATGRSNPLLIVNCTAANLLTLEEYNDAMMKLTSEFPLPNSYQKATTLNIQKNQVLYWASAAFEHYAPAFTIDTILKIIGKKPRLVPLYQFFDSAMETTNFFLTHNWTYNKQNFKNLMKYTDPEDNQIFNVDLNEYYLQSASKDIPTAATFYAKELDKKSILERRKIVNKRYWLTTLIKTLVFFCMCSPLYLLISDAVYAIQEL